MDQLGQFLINFQALVPFLVFFIFLFTYKQFLNQRQTLNQENKEVYKNKNLNFLRVNSFSKSSTQRAKLKLLKITKIFQVNQENKNAFYASREWQLLRSWVFANFNNVCFSCFSSEALEVDHIKPITHRPGLSLRHTNVQILCRNCNGLKSNKTSRKFKASIHKKPTYQVTQEIKELGKGGKWEKFFPKVNNPK